MKKSSEKETTIVVLLIIVTLIILLFPSSWAMSFFRSIGTIAIPFEYIGHNLSGIGGIIRIILIILIDGCGIGRCIYLHYHNKKDN